MSNAARYSCVMTWQGKQFSEEHTGGCRLRRGGQHRGVLHRMRNRKAIGDGGTLSCGGTGSEAAAVIVRIRLGKLPHTLPCTIRRADTDGTCVTLGIGILHDLLSLFSTARSVCSSLYLSARLHRWHMYDSCRQHRTVPQSRHVT
jgi:hypothetical protein